MIDKVIQFSIKNKAIIGLFTLVLVLYGAYSLSQLPIDAVPDITNNQVQVITTTPTLAAQEVEQFVTAPIERAMATALCGLGQTAPNPVLSTIRHFRHEYEAHI